MIEKLSKSLSCDVPYHRVTLFRLMSVHSIMVYFERGWHRLRFNANTKVPRPTAILASATRTSVTDQIISSYVPEQLIPCCRRSRLFIY